MRVRIALLVGAVCVCLAVVIVAQDAVKVDAKHYSVISENDQVRIVKVHYGVGEKSVMHSHPNSVAVFLTDGHAKMTTPDGKSQDMNVKAGDTMYSSAGSHLPENVGDKPFELILVELKK